MDAFKLIIVFLSGLFIGMVFKETAPRRDEDVIEKFYKQSRIYDVNGTPLHCVVIEQDFE